MALTRILNREREGGREGGREGEEEREREKEREREREREGEREDGCVPQVWYLGRVSRVLGDAKHMFCATAQIWMMTTYQLYRIPHIWIDLEDADYLTHISGTGGFDTHHQQPVLAGSVGGDGIPS